MTNIRKIFRAKAAEYEVEAEEMRDPFTKGYFEGKAEAFKLAQTAMSFSEDEDIIDVINGDM